MADDSSMRVEATWPGLTPEEVEERRLVKRANRLILLKTIAGSIIATILLLVLSPPLGILISFFLPWIDSKIYVKRRVNFVRTGDWILEQPYNDEFLAEIFIEVDGVVRGADRGIVWFEHGCVCFTGKRSWFRILATDLQPPSRPAYLNDSFQEMVTSSTTISVRSEGHDLRIKMTPDALSESTANARFEHLVEHLRFDHRPSKEPGRLPIMAFDPEYRHNILENTELISARISVFVFALLADLAFSIRYPAGAIILGLSLMYMAQVPIVRLVRPANLRRKAKRLAKLRALIPSPLNLKQPADLGR